MKEKVGNTSAFLMLGSKWRFTNIYHQESHARGRTYKASSPRLDFFSKSTERAEIPPATQYRSLWSFDATFLCIHMTPLKRKKYHSTNVSNKKIRNYSISNRRFHWEKVYLKDSNKSGQESCWTNWPFNSKPTGASRVVHKLKEINENAHVLSPY